MWRLLGSDVFNSRIPLKSRPAILGKRNFGSFCIWMLPQIVVPQNGWFIRENLIKKDDLGVPLFLGNTHIITKHFRYLKGKESSPIKIEAWRGVSPTICAGRHAKKTHRNQRTKCHNAPYRHLDKGQKKASEKPTLSIINAHIKPKNTCSTYWKHFRPVIIAVPLSKLHSLKLTVRTWK